MTQINPNSWTKVTTGPCQVVFKKGEGIIYVHVGSTPPSDLTLSQSIIPSNDLNWFPVMTINDLWARGEIQEPQVLPLV